MQSTSVVFMVRPAHFGFNPETANSNAFQSDLGVDSAELHQRVLQEFDQMVELLRHKGVEVLVLPDRAEVPLPDAVFPNNWVSFHDENGAALYPMQAQNRRLERRADLPDWLREHGFCTFQIQDFSLYETENQFLEGTGSLVLDRLNKFAYASISIRTNPELVTAWCRHFGYEPVVFHSADAHGNPIYHTNVLMAIGEKLAVICAEAINPEDRERVQQKLTESGKELVLITMAQMNAFAGNMLELLNNQGERLMVMSAQAKAALLPEQLAQINRHNRIISPDVQTIERHGGGSVRCMLAEVFLPRQTGPELP